MVDWTYRLDLENLTVSHFATAVLIPTVLGLWFKIMDLMEKLSQAKKEHMEDLKEMQSRHDGFLERYYRHDNPDSHGKSRDHSWN